MNIPAVSICLSTFLSAFLFNGRADELIISSTISGTWYSGDKKTLEAQIEKFFKNAGKPELRRDIISLILPHAGYSYSGQIAVDAIKQVSRNYKTVIVIGPSHSLGMKNSFSVPEFDYYETPLGRIPSDKDLIKKLNKNEIFMNIPQALDREHSVQIQIPLLQYALKDFKLVFIIAGQCDYKSAEKAGKYIGSIMNADTLLVASSDFIHCGPRFGYIPFKENTFENLRTVDMEAYKYIERKDAAGLMKFVEESGATICGAVPISVTLCAMPEKAEAKLIKYTDSGTISGDRSNTVSYISAIFTGEWKMRENETAQIRDSELLSEENKKTLLLLARKTIEYYLKNKREPAPSDLNVRIPENLKMERAAFVTLHKDGHLRGCIGEIFPSQSLYKSVISNAVNATVNDYRFSKVTESELPGIEIEISALTIPREVPAFSDIRLGRDGIVLQKQFNKAVFLPQVAPEQGWNLDQTLTNLAMKAGLPPDAWKEGAKFLTFQADVFGEK